MAQTTKRQSSQPTLLDTVVQHDAEVPSQPEHNAQPQAPANGQRQNNQPTPPESDAQPRHTNSSAKNPAKNLVIHHHLIVQDKIISCHPTMSEALHTRQKLREQQPNALVTTESYAGESECRRHQPLDLDAWRAERQEQKLESAVFSGEQHDA